MDFGEALRHVKAGGRAAREGWNGKDMWIAMTPGNPQLASSQFWSPHAREYAASNGGKARVNPCLLMKTADGAIQMGWLASQTDMLAEDWVFVA